EDDSVPPAHPHRGADLAPADETWCPQRRCAAQALRQSRQTWSAKPHAAPQSGPAPGAKLPCPAHLLNASPKARDMPCSPLPSATKRTAVVAQTTTAASGPGPHAQPAAAWLALRPPDYRQGPPAPGA